MRKSFCKSKGKLVFALGKVKLDHCVKTTHYLTVFINLSFFLHRTIRDADVEPLEQAVSGRDYVALQSTVDMTDGVTRLPVEVTILAVSPDIIPNLS